MAGPTHYIKQHDLGPSIEHVLSDVVTVNGVATTTPVDLTGATVTCNLRLAGATTPKVTRTAVIVAAASGRVRYDPVSPDTDTAGTFEGEWQVSGGAVGKRTFPSVRADNFTVQIDPDLDNA